MACTIHTPVHAPPPAPPDRPHHRLRRRIHLFFFLVFCALPFFNVMRFDIPKQRFYFAGVELWISEFSIIFFSLMFLMFSIVALSMIYGRVYCGYACPQMIFSETASAVEERLRKWVTKKFIAWPAARRRWLQRTLTYGIIGAASVVLAFVFISYFVEPRDLLRRLTHLDVATSAGFAGAVTTLITFLDFAFLRQKFCTTLCPYGYLQGMLADGNTLLVQYRDPQHLCIECKKCVRICHMGIDIRDSPFQIECIHCGECIDACEEVMTRVKRPVVIEYSWGREGPKVAGGGKQSWLYRMGIRDAKRRIVLLVMLFYASALGVALSMRNPVLVRINPIRTTSLYTIDSAGEVENQFRISVSNRGAGNEFVVVSIDGLPGGRLELTPNPIPAHPGATEVKEFSVAVPANAPLGDVTHFRLVTESQPDGKRGTVDMTWLMPPKNRKGTP
ncbi:MAG: 4Fe-4S dicluster domain-containing protein [Bryobacteraceae bacterium]|jgi:polyferredoxin